MQAVERGIQGKEPRGVQVGAQTRLIHGVPHDERGLEGDRPDAVADTQGEVGVLSEVQPSGEQTVVPKPLKASSTQDGLPPKDHVRGQKAAGAAALHHARAHRVERRAHVRDDRALQPGELGLRAQPADGHREPVGGALGVVVGEENEVVAGSPHAVVPAPDRAVTAVGAPGDVTHQYLRRRLQPLHQPPDRLLLSIIEDDDLDGLVHALGSDEHGAQAARQGGVAVPGRHHDRDTARNLGQGWHGRRAAWATMRAMRIGIDARLAGPGLGVARFIGELCRGLVATTGVEIVWFGDPALAPAGAYSGNAVHRYPYPVLDSPVGRRWVAGFGLDVMHLPGNTGWERPGPVPFVLTVHDLIFRTTSIRNRSLRQVVGHRYSRRNTPRAARAAARVAAPSQTTASEVEALLPGLDVTVIPNGVETPPASDTKPSESSPYIVAFSGRDPRKGVDLALEGLRAAGADVPHRMLVLAGAGLPDGFESRAAAELASGRLELRGYLSRAEMWEVLRGASALVYPSSAEGFGLPVIEAMSAGVPVISGLAPATREIGGEAMLLIDPAAPSRSIAAALERLHANDGLRERLVAAGASRAREFSWERTTARYLELYVEATAWSGSR